MRCGKILCEKRWAEKRRSAEYSYIFCEFKVCKSWKSFVDDWVHNQPVPGVDLIKLEEVPYACYHPGLRCY